jgi:hypothetical protein
MKSGMHIMPPEAISVAYFITLPPISNINTAVSQDVEVLT